MTAGQRVQGLWSGVFAFDTPLVTSHHSCAAPLYPSKLFEFCGSNIFPDSVPTARKDNKILPQRMRLETRFGSTRNSENSSPMLDREVCRSLAT